MGLKGIELEKYNSLIGLLSTVKTTLEGMEKPFEMEGIVAKIQKGDDGIYATLDEIILNVTDIQKNAFNSVEEYLEGMKGKEVQFRAKDKKTGQAIEISGVLRDGAKNADNESYSVILDDVVVPVTDIVSTRKVDLLSTEQQLLAEILKTLRRMEEQVPGLVTEPEVPEDDTEGVNEVEDTEGTGSAQATGGEG